MHASLSQLRHRRSSADDDLKCKPTCRVSLLRSRTMIAQSAWRDQSSEDSEIKTLGRKIDVETLSFENG
ncbi:MAG: hypothetical protein QOH31_4478 [Verrucomicrobiota bacterium]